MSKCKHESHQGLVISVTEMEEEACASRTRGTTATCSLCSESASFRDYFSPLPVFGPHWLPNPDFREYYTRCGWELWHIT